LVVGLANDWLRDNFKEVKDFEDNVGNAVVSGWNKVSDGVSDFFGGVFFMTNDSIIEKGELF
jgi:hypothetical protein